MANQWFRLYSEFATDPKVQMLPEAYQRRFVMLLCLRCSNVTVTLQDEEVAFQLRISIDEWAETKRVFLEKRLILEDNTPANWDKRQSTDFLRPSAEVWKKIRDEVFVRDDFTCQYCGAIGVKLECDHKIPICRGGSNDKENLATACFQCNRSKHKKLLTEWRKE